MAKSRQPSVTESPLYHDTWKLLQNYRDVVWSLELSVQQAKNSFRHEFGQSIDEFLDSIYMAGADLSGTELQEQARCIQRSKQMLDLLNTAIDVLRKKHKSGEDLYWILYYTYLTPKKPRNANEVIDRLQAHIRDISYRTYYRRRQDAIEALSSILWGYTSRDCMAILEQFFPET